MVEQRKPDSDYYNSWKFTGKELDEETGLYYYGARFYQPSWSLWMSVDPFVEEYPTWNPYNYVMQNPLINIDPDGNGVKTIFKNTTTNEEVEIKDGIDRTIEVNDSDFEKAKEFRDYIHPLEGNGERSTRLVSQEVEEAYINFYNSVNSYDGYSLANLYDYFSSDPKLLRNDRIITGTVPDFSKAASAKSIKLAKKLFKSGSRKSTLPTPNNSPYQFVKKGGQRIHKDTKAIFRKSNTSHKGDKWKAWPRNTEDFSPKSKGSTGRISLDKKGNIKGN